MPAETMMTRAPGTAATRTTIGLKMANPPEERLAELPELEAYFFDEQQRLLGSAPVRTGTVQIETFFTGLRLVRAIIAPRGMHPRAVLANSTLPSASAECSKAATLELAPGWWNVFRSGQILRYWGHVEKNFGEGCLPACDGTVEVFAVDPFSWLETRSDAEIACVRDEILKMWAPWAFQGQTPWLNCYPWAWSNPYGAGPGATAYAGWTGYPGYTGYWGYTGYGNPPEPPGPYPTSDGWSAPASGEMPCDPTLLAGTTGSALRAFFQANKYRFLPWFCRVVPDWWYRMEEIGQTPIRADGTFSDIVGWLKEGSPRPNLYFRVCQTLHGINRHVYRPPAAAGTWWGYGGGEVILRVTDPEAACREYTLVAQGTEIVFRGIGFDTFAPPEGGAGLVQEGEYAGYYRHPNGQFAPYGGTLHFCFDVDLQSLHKAGIRYYRLSYRKGCCAEGTGSWTPLTTPTVRRYCVEKETEGRRTFHYPGTSLATAPSELPPPLADQEGIFHFPEPGLDYAVFRPEERAYGIWDTRWLANECNNPADACGIYTLRMEVFDASGRDVTSNVPFWLVCRNYPGGEYTKKNAPNGPYLYVWVDNRPVVAEVNPCVRAGEASTRANCGILCAEPGTQFALGIRAYHPAGYACNWRCTVRRSNGAVANCYTGNMSVGNEGEWYTIPGGGFSGPTANELLAGIPTGTNTPYGWCGGNEMRGCAYTIALEATCFTRDGYRCLSEYNSNACTSFALVEKGYVPYGNVTAAPVEAAPATNPRINRPAMPMGLLGAEGRPQG